MPMMNDSDFGFRSETMRWIDWKMTRRATRLIVVPVDIGVDEVVDKAIGRPWPRPTFTYSSQTSRKNCRIPSSFLWSWRSTNLTISIVSDERLGIRADDTESEPEGARRTRGQSTRGQEGSEAEYVAVAIASV
jgi:hypothetical protein